MKKKLSLVQPKESETHMTPWGRVWTRGADVMATFRRMGWVPPTEYRNDYNFRVIREGGKPNEVP